MGPPKPSQGNRDAPTPKNTKAPVPGRPGREDARELIRKFENKLGKDFFNEAPRDYSKEYETFRRETLKNLGWYEKACQNIGKSLTIKGSKKDEEKLERNIQESHLNVKPNEVSGFSWFALLFALFLTLMICAAIYLLTNKIGGELLLIFFLLICVSFFLFYYFNTLPSRVAQKWRLKASSQMIPCILYIVVHMRHTSNLERAIKFASEHLQPPLSLDLKKIFWDTETAKYSTIKDALDAYLEGWRDSCPEFVESFHMIESSLYEPVEERRVAVLDKALQIILDGVYEKMLHFTHDVKSPITNIYMLGIVLPTLGLALLPLGSTLLQGAISWYHVVVLFNLVIPFAIFYMTNNVLAKRPGGFGETELLERNKNYHYYADKRHYWKAFFIAFPLFILGILPFIFQFGSSLLGVKKDYTFADIGLGFLGSGNLFDFRLNALGQVVGPFGVVALILSLFVPLSVALFFILLYKLKTEKLVKTRNQTKRLEQEFSGSIFQLGNRLADGTPAEMCFGRVAQSAKGSPSAGFFSMVNMNIQQAGMSIEEAIFNPARGAINYYPSEILKTSMQIMIEAVKKGLGIAANALMSISTYVKNIHDVNERLKDLLADITSSMKSNMTFLAPLLAAIIVGLSAMITGILGKLKLMIEGGVSTETSVLGAGSIGTIVEMFDITKMIPPYWLQASVGIYIVEVIFILTITLVTIEEGEDKLGEKYQISKNLSMGMMLYFITALIAIISLAVLASVAIGGISPG
jgi:Flp pilus assembly protein TadB